MTDSESCVDDVSAVLASAVVLAAGKDACPRSGQSVLAVDVFEALSEGGHLAGEAPTGVGKSLAYLVPAAVRAVCDGERTVVSTESLALQAQLIDKDLPVVSKACRAVLGSGIKFAVLKGWRNYPCLARVADVAAVLAGAETSADTPDGVKEMLSTNPGSVGLFAVSGGGLSGVDRDAVSATAGWVVAEIEAGREADRHSFPGVLDGRVWAELSVTTDECLGEDSCGFADRCPALKSRREVSAADIVVTNHAMCAIQAARGATVVVGSVRLGRMDHVVVDEAHALARTVRSQGASEMSGARVGSVVKALRSVLSEQDPRVAAVLKQGSDVGVRLDGDVAKFAEGKGVVVKLGDGDDPLADVGTDLEFWVERVSAMLGAIRPLMSDTKTRMSLKRAKARLVSLSEDLDAARVHEVGVARWVERSDRHGALVVKVSPVDVSGMLFARLWNTDDPDDDSPEPRYALSVVAVSATLPGSFVVDLGLSCRRELYESPFADAYLSSLFFAPRVESGTPDVAVLAPRGGEKPRFDTREHPVWALGVMAGLIEANGGGALVLSATTAAGKKYVEGLRRVAAGRWEVMSQWDGVATRRVVAAWRADPSAVLVGTRGLMTGVDAPGETCSLVVVDRVPRSAMNPVDDARVEMLSSRLEIDRWAADRLVYVADAALLLEQAAGRLIRSTQDSGMVAVLDPRLCGTGAFKMAHPSRKVFMEAMSRFRLKTSDFGEAVEFLSRRNNGSVAI